MVSSQNKPNWCLSIKPKWCLSIKNSEEIKINDIKLKGVAILKNTLTEYFSEGGAVLTLISHKTYKKIKKKSSGTKLDPYTGEGLRSVNS